MASELEVANVKAETYRSGRSDGDVYIQAATASDFVAIGTQVSSTLLKVDGSGKLSCVNDITIQKNNGNLILHGTADGSQQAVLFRNDEDEDKGFIKYRDTYSSAGGNTMEVGTDGTTRLTIDSTGLATFSNGIALQTSPTNASATAGEAYTLDKYETGTWTPVYAPSSGSFAAMSMDVLSAKYTRIGNVVLVEATIRTDDVDITGGSGSLRINGLPFPVAGSGAYGTVYIGEAGSFASGKFPCAGYCTVSQSYITLTKLSGVAGSILGAQVDSLTTGTTANQNSLIFAARYTS